MDSLTREQAIKRVKDIRAGRSVGHLTESNFSGSHLVNDCERGAINELTAIFEIEESELK